MKKVVRIGTVLEQRPSYNVPPVPTDVFCKVEIKKGGNLSISGVVGPRNNGDCWGSCGQIEMSMKAEDVTPAPGWTPEMVAEFFRVWRAWHLNDMKANCQHQTGPDWDPARRVEVVTYKLNRETLCKSRDIEREAREKLEKGDAVQYTGEELALVNLPYTVKIGAGQSAPASEYYEVEKRESHSAGHTYEKEGGFLCKPCPVCGYKYGSEWRREELPAEVVAFLESLPDTDKTPAWV